MSLKKQKSKSVTITRFELDQALSKTSALDFMFVHAGKEIIELLPNFDSASETNILKQPFLVSLKFRKLINEKIYEPYYISHSTIIDFEQRLSRQNYSLQDILHTFSKKRAKVKTFYFKSKY